MCTSSSAVDETKSGTISNDSVVLRIITHQHHCICQLTLLNQTKDDKLYLRKHDGYKYAVPINDSCGLTVDIHHIPTGNQKTIDPIQSTKPTSAAKITLVKNGRLQFQSRQIDGIFTRGYCIQIMRGKNTVCDNYKISLIIKESTNLFSTSWSIILVQRQNYYSTKPFPHKIYMCIHV